MSLHEAIKAGNEELVASLAEDGALLNDKDEKRDTPLHISAEEGRVEITLLLLRKGADKDARNIVQKTPLHRAAFKLHTPVVRVLVEAGADATIGDMYGRTPLVASLSAEGPTDRILEVVTTMIELGVEVNCPDVTGGFGLSPFHEAGTPLHTAVSRELDDCVDVLVAAGANVDARDSGGQTPLHIAAEKGSAGMTLLLLSRGADMNVNDRSQLTPLHLAARRAHVPVVRALMEAGADATLQANTATTPLTSAIDYGSDGTLEVIQAMIELGADVNGRDAGGYTPLHVVAFRGLDRPFPQQAACIDMLVAAGADLEARGPRGRTPLNEGAAQIAAVRSLVNHGVDVNTQDNEGNTPLHRAIGDRFMNPNYAETVDALLQAGANEAVLDCQGRLAAETSVNNCYDLQDWEEQQTRARELLRNAPWRRRTLLVMCIERHRRGEAQLLDNTAGSATDGWASVAARVLDMGLDVGKQKIFRAIVGFL